MKQRAASIIAEDFVIAKVRGMRSKLFEGNRLLALADSRSLPELFRRVRPGGAFEGHLAFERGLLADHIRELDLVLRYLPRRVFPLFQWLLAYYQLENLKVALRAYLAKVEFPDAEAMMTPTPPHLALPLSQLFAAPDLRRFAERVPVAEFREAMLDLLRAGGAPDRILLETALDKAYCERLLQLSSAADEWSRRLVAFDVDTRSLFLIFRSKFSYHSDFADIERFLVASGDYLKLEDAPQLFAAHDLPRAIALVPRSLLPNDRKRGILSLQQLEEALSLQQYRLAGRCFLETIVDIASVVAYCYIKRVEFANLVRLTESIRHSLSRAEIEGRLLLPTR